MHSRAFLLLRRDLINLERFPLEGIAAQPHSDNLFHWNVKIEGLEETIWEGGIFQICISFTEEFNNKLPEVHFMTIPFHPNGSHHYAVHFSVDAKDGSPALPHGNWDEQSTISSLLLNLQALLSNPELNEDCVRNPAAAKLFREAPLTYKQMALNCVTASLRVEAGLTPYDTESGGRTPVTPDMLGISTREKRAQLKPVSFDDYHTLWRGIATSITGYKKPNDFLNLLENDQHLHHVHCGGDQMMGPGLGVQHNPPVHIETAPLEQRVNEHILLKYGKSSTKCPVSKSETKSRAQRIEQLKQMYRQGMDINTGAGGRPPEHGPENRERGMEVPDEVEKLLEWTNNLDERVLNTPIVHV